MLSVRCFLFVTVVVLICSSPTESAHEIRNKRQVQSQEPLGNPQTQPTGLPKQNSLQPQNAGSQGSPVNEPNPNVGQAPPARIPDKNRWQQQNGRMPNNNRQEFDGNRWQQQNQGPNRFSPQNGRNGRRQNERRQNGNRGRGWGNQNRRQRQDRDSDSDSDESRQPYARRQVYSNRRFNNNNQDRNQRPDPQNIKPAPVSGPPAINVNTPVVAAPVV